MWHAGNFCCFRKNDETRAAGLQLHSVEAPFSRKLKKRARKMFDVSMATFVQNEARWLPEWLEYHALPQTTELSLSIAAMSALLFDVPLTGRVVCGVTMVRCDRYRINRFDFGCGCVSGRRFYLLLSFSTCAAATARRARFGSPLLMMHERKPQVQVCSQVGWLEIRIWGWLHRPGGGVMSVTWCSLH